MGRRVFHRYSSLHQGLSQVTNVVLMLCSKLTALFRPQDPNCSQSSVQHGGREGGGEDEAGSIASDHVHQICTASNVASNVPKRLAKGSRNDVHLMQESVPLSYPGPVLTIKSHSMNLIDVREGSVLVSNLTKILERTHCPGHGMHGLKGHDLWDVYVHRLQQGFQVGGIVVSENVFGNSTVSYPLNHGRVVSSIRENVAPWQCLGEGKEGGVVSNITGSEEEGGRLLMKRRQLLLQILMEQRVSRNVSSSPSPSSVVLQRFPVITGSWLRENRAKFLTIEAYRTASFTAG